MSPGVRLPGRGVIFGWRGLNQPNHTVVRLIFYCVEKAVIAFGEEDSIHRVGKGKEEKGDGFQ